MKDFTTEVLVVGAGPAGMAAAVRGRRCRAQVTVLDDNVAAGGQIWRGGTTNFWLRSFRRSGARLLSGAQVVAAEGDTLLVEQPAGAFAIRYRKLILATGARELFLPFPGWTLPGVMGVGGLQAMAKGGMPVRGKRIVVAGSGPLLLAVGAHLREWGARVATIAEQAPRGRVVRFAAELAAAPAKLAQAAILRAGLASVPYQTDCWVESAQGNGCVESVQLRSKTRTWTEACDYAAVAYGLWPNVELARLLGCGTHGERGVTVDENQQTTRPDVFAAGECTGIGGMDLALVEGQIAGLAACGRLQDAPYLPRTRARAQRFAGSLRTAFALRPELREMARPDTVVCRCEDVRMSELGAMPSLRAAKLHVRCGMGPCQARICGPACRFLFGWDVDAVRPPILPVALGSLIGTRA